MEGEHRDQKLKAGKEKLAQFQKKKKKKKPPVNEPDNYTFTPDAATASIVPQVLYAEEIDELHHHVNTLTDAVSRRNQESDGARNLDIEQLLDSNHNCNEGIMERTTQSPEPSERQSSPAHDAHASNSMTGSLPVSNDVVGSQPVSISDVQELMGTVQWLQLQLKQANSTVQVQNKKHLETVGALENAKREISNLQDSINTKDELLNNVVEKMTQLSKEFSTLKQNYVQLTKVRNEDLAGVLEREAKLREDLSQAVKNELEERDVFIHKLEDSHKAKIAHLKEEADITHAKLKEEFVKIKEENSKLVHLSEDYLTEKENLEIKCDTLTKGLEFLKVEHERSVSELNVLSNEYKDLKSSYDILLEEKEKLRVEMMHLESDNSNNVEHINMLQGTINGIELQLAERIECGDKLKSSHEQLLKDNTILADELTKVKEDNCMYQKQIHAFEEKLVENEEVLDENHSLHLHNDELNNKINNQKDVIASLKNELNILSMENKQLADQLENVACVKTENTDLKKERDALLNELSTLSNKIVNLEGENSKLKDSQLILNEEISCLKENLFKADANIPMEVPLVSCVQGDVIFVSQNIDTNHDEGKSLLVHETIVAEVDPQIKSMMTPVAQRAVDFQAVLPDDNEDDSDKLSAAGHTDDTAYESFHRDSVCQTSADESDENDKQLIDLQQDYDNVLQALHRKAEECEELQNQLEEARLNLTKITSTAPAPVVQMDNVDNQSDYELPKVSENDSVASLEQEVNVHASSSLCFVENDGVVPLDNSQGIVTVGESDVHVLPSDAFQPTTDGTVDPDEPVQTNVLTESTIELNEKLGAAEDRIALLEEEICELKKVCDESGGTIIDLKKCVESHVINEQIMRKDYENASAKNLELQAQFQKQVDDIKGSEEKVNNLKYINEKLSWECDEMRTVNDGLEKRILELKADKSDVEFEKLQFEEELKRVRERLDYLESSESDIMEIKDMLERVQEERENIYIENEKLQGSLSAQIGENEKLLETLECLHKENSLSLQKLKEVGNERSHMSIELENLRLVNDKLNNDLTEERVRNESLNEKFSGEIDGLLEENSTLKTSVEMKNSEIDSLRIDNERLSSFFPNIDKQDDQSALKIKYDDLESKAEELSIENEQIMNELVQTHEKVLELSDENECLVEKCEEFQKVINELDDEKSSLLNTVDDLKQDISIKLTESNALIEKYEIQLEGLDQENSTLKTQVISLRQDIENNECVSDSDSTEQTMQSSDISDLMEENEQLKLKCASIESTLHEIQEKEHYLVEKLKTYENDVGSSTNRSDQEIKRLLAQLELEKKYKHKIENDLESAQNETSALQKKNKDLQYDFDQQQRDMTVLSSEVNVMKLKEGELMFKIQVAESENENLIKEFKDLKQNMNDCNTVNKDLNCQVSMLQHHVHAMSENCSHVRSQVEILAAEVDNSMNAKDVLQCQYNDLAVVCERSKYENKVLVEQVEHIESGRLELERECEKLMREYENLTAKLDEEDFHENNDAVNILKDDLEKTICAYEEAKVENEKLKEDLESFGLRSEELNELRQKNCELQFENSQLQNKNEILNEQLESFRDKLNQVDELIEINRISCAESDDLVQRMDTLHEIIKELQSEKEALQKVTDELTNMLHDMQGKYEEVKSEMETAKKECSNEIVQLENKLHDMNNDVCELRKMLDFMENEIYSASAEKTILKENLEQQQTQYAEVVEQKQKLEEILSHKQQKDLKNMKVASQRHKNSSMNLSRSEQELTSCEAAFVPDTEQLSTNQVQENFVMQPVTFCEIPSEMPSFESAIHMFGFDTSQDDNQYSRHVQTNVSFIGTENVGIMVDDNGEHFENIKDLNLIDCGTQTISNESGTQIDLVSEILKGIDIPGDVFLFEQSEEQSESGSFTESDDISSLATEYNLASLDPILYQPQVNKITGIQIKPSPNDVDQQTNDQALVMNERGCQSKKNSLDDLKTVEPDGGDGTNDISATALTECCIGLSESDVLSMFDKSESENVDHSCAFVQDSDVHGQSIELTEDELDKFVNASVQTEVVFDEVVSEDVEKEVKKLKSVYDENLNQLEADIETRLLKQFDFREQKVKLLEDSYEKKVRQIEYDMEEKFVQKFRDREAEIIVEAERDKKAHAAEVENSARRRIERITTEKNQQFVEALRQVKADFSKQRKPSSDIRRAKSDDTRHTVAQTGPGGDKLPSDGVGKEDQLQKLQLENQELSSARNVLLQQIDISQQEQEVLVEQLQVIMGEQNAMNRTKDTPSNQLAPAWLDWELNPEMSFDSVRSSLETKSLTDSLDTTCYCTNSDCLNVRMKYDQLIDRIQQFLKMRTTLGEPDKSSQVEMQAHSKHIEPANNNIETSVDDRYIAHDEPDSQSLQRITSIHLEHSVRVPTSAGTEGSNDQFVQEAEYDITGNNDAVIMGNDIIDLLVKSSSEIIRSRNEDGRFSESESDEDDELDTSVKHVHGDFVSKDVNASTSTSLQRSKLLKSYVAGDNFSDEDKDKVHIRKRHFSESDAQQGTEGSFVAEKFDYFVKTDDNNFVSEDEDVFERSRDTRSMSHQSDRFQLSLNQSSTFNTDDTSRDCLTPGSEEIFVSEKPLSRTGEETGDFFDEKVECSVSFPTMSRIHQSDQNSKYLEHQASDQKYCKEDLTKSGADDDHFDSGDILETLGSENKLIARIQADGVSSQSQFVKEESEVTKAIHADVLGENLSIKTDSPVSPRRNTRDASQSPQGEVKQNKKSAKLSYENAVFDILNSICPGTDPGRRPTAEVLDDFHPVSKESVSGDISESQAENDLKKLGVESREINSTIQSLVNENEKLKNVIQLNKAENEKHLNILVDKVSDLNDKNEQLERELKYLDDLKPVKQSYLDLSAEMKQLQQHFSVLNSELEIKKEQCKEFESINAELIRETEKKIELENQIKNLQDALHESEKLTARLSLEKTKLVDDNSKLESVSKSHSELLEKQDQLKSQIEKASKEKEEAQQMLQEFKANVLQEKTDLENSLLSLANLYEELEREKSVADQSITATNEILNQERSRAKQQKLETEQLVHEITGLKDEKNHLNHVISGLKKANEDLKSDVGNHIECIENLKSEKEIINEEVKKLECINQDLQATVLKMNCSLEEFSESEKNLNKQIGQLQSKVESLESEITDMTAQLSSLKKDNDVLKCKEDDAQYLKSENEKLRSEMSVLKERNIENEWALRELSAGIEKEEINKPELIDKSVETDLLAQDDVIDGIGKNVAPDSFSAMNDTSPHREFEVEIAKLTEENQSLKVMLGQLDEIEDLRKEVEALRLENETLKRSLDQVMARSDSDTDLQIIEDMKDAIKSMDAEKASAEIHQKALNVNTGAENKRLQEEVDELYSENDMLRKKLTAQEENARKENSEILKMYSDLRDEVEVLVISKHDLEVELHALKDLLEHDPFPAQEKSSLDSSKELTLQDLEEMECLKTSIEKLKSDLKEKDGYVRKLEEHLLNVGNNLPDLTSTPKPLLSRGTPKTSKSFLRRPAYHRIDRRAFSHDLPEIVIHPDTSSSSKHDLERSHTLDSSLHVTDLATGNLPSERQFSHKLIKQANFTSSLGSDSNISLSSINESSNTDEKIKSGLSAKEDGHLALELKQFELVAEITKLRRDFRETKAVYAKETALLTEALEKEKMTNELRGISDFHVDYSVGSNLSHDLLKLRKEVSRLREENKMLTIDCDRWVDRLQEQEQIVADLKDKLSRNTSEYGEIEEVFGRQLALLQKQREELINQLQEKNRENICLSESIGAKGIIEETLRREKEILLLKMKNMESIEQELDEKNKELEKAAFKLKEVEDIVYQKDLNEIELMKQKRILEEELKEIEARFRDKEENLDFEKNRLLNELKEKDLRGHRSRFSESDDDLSSVCSESAAYSDRNIGRLEIMLEEVEKQHLVAVNVLRDQLRIKHNRREKELRKEHAAGMAKLKHDTRKQVNQPQNV